MSRIRSVLDCELFKLDNITLSRMCVFFSVCIRNAFVYPEPKHLGSCIFEGPMRLAVYTTVLLSVTLFADFLSRIRNVLDCEVFKFDNIALSGMCVRLSVCIRNAFVYLELKHLGFCIFEGTMRLSVYIRLFFICSVLVSEAHKSVPVRDAIVHSEQVWAHVFSPLRPCIGYVSELPLMLPTRGSSGMNGFV